MDDLSHREDWTEFQARAQELREVIETLQSRDPVELICGTETGMEELHSAAMATFVAMAIYFGHFEARYMIGWHSTATGKCKGYRIGKLRDNLKQLEDPTAKMLAAGQLRQFACDAGILPIILGGPSGALDVGREQRLVTP